MLRASGSKLGQRARKKSIYNPLALRSLQDFESRIRFSWESGNSWEGAAVETPTHDPSYPPSLFREEEMGRGGCRGCHGGLQETLTWTETSARPTSFSAQHVTFFLLRSLVTLTRVSPRDGRSPDFWTREERVIRRASAGIGKRQGIQRMCLGALWFYMERLGRRREGGQRMASFTVCKVASGSEKI